MQTGRGIDSVAVGGITVSGDTLGLQGSSFNLSAMALYAADVNGRYIGAITNPSNIEGDVSRVVLDTAFWQQAWFKQADLGFSTRLGMFDLNSEFISTESAAQLINSSFGMDPCMTENFSVSTFPKNGSGLVATLGTSADTDNAPLALKVALFQGDVDTQTHPFSQGLLSMAEAQWRPLEHSALKLGLWEKHGNDQPSVHGAYLSAEGRFWQHENSALDGFVRASYADNKQKTDGDIRPKNYWAAGLSWDAPLTGRPNDIFTLGFGGLQLEGGGAANNGRERFVEISYVAQISEHVYIQPDLQYLQSPSGEYPDAWVGIVRLHIE
jgi:porin